MPHGFHLLGDPKPPGHHAPIRNVVVDREEPADVSCPVADRADRDPDDDEPAVPGPVEDLRAEGPSGLDGAPELLVEGGALPAALQEPRVGADGLLSAVAVGARERRVDVGDGPGRVRQKDDADGLLDRGREAPELVLNAVPLGDVPRRHDDAGNGGVLEEVRAEGFETPHRSVGVPDGVLDRDRRRRVLDAPAERRDDLRDVGRADHSEDLVPDDLLREIAEEPLDRRARKSDDPVGVDDRDDVQRGGDERLRLPLGAPEGLLRRGLLPPRLLELHRVADRGREAGRRQTRFDEDFECPGPEGPDGGVGVRAAGEDDRRDRRAALSKGREEREGPFVAGAEAEEEDVERCGLDLVPGRCGRGHVAHDEARLPQPVPQAGLEEDRLVPVCVDDQDACRVGFCAHGSVLSRRSGSARAIVSPPGARGMRNLTARSSRPARPGSAPAAGP